MRYITETHLLNRDDENTKETGEKVFLLTWQNVFESIFRFQFDFLSEVERSI